MKRIPSVVAQHTEEAAFSWLLRDNAAVAPHYVLRDLAALDARLDAHLDGLRIAGADGWSIIRDELQREEPGEVFVGAVLAFESGDSLRIDEVLSVGARSRELTRGLISALGWLPAELAIPHVTMLLESGDPLRQRAGIGGLAVQRLDPGEKLGDWATLASPLPRARALRAIGELGRTNLVGCCTQGMADQDADVRFWAAWSAARLGSADGLDGLYRFVVDGDPRAEAATDLLVRRLPLDQALGWQWQLTQEASTLRFACVAAGAIGDPVAIPRLIELMSSDELARTAGDAFTRITGVDLAYEDMERYAPDGFESGPTEDPDDEDVALDPDENLPWPDRDLVAKWWAKNAARFASGTRYLLGEPLAPASLLTALHSAGQRQRAAAALELAIQSPWAALFETRARGDWQVRSLGAS